MFTGIIESLGKIKNLNKNSIEILIESSDFNLGDSVSINGICLTVKSIQKEKQSMVLGFDISNETYSRTNIKYAKINEYVNVERAMQVNSRFDGHIVTGHIDDVSRIVGIKKLQENYEFTFSIPKGLEKFIAEKGSVALDGISLTVAKKLINKFTVAVIPYTFEHTNLKFKKSGDYMNLEIDILARYLFSILQDYKK